jgi:hypothetical protein
MDTSTLLLMPPLLLAQQITTTISTRAKVSTRLGYCLVAAFLSHLTWIISNGFILWQVGKEFNKGVTADGIFAMLAYASIATAGNGVGQALAHWYETRYHK